MTGRVDSAARLIEAPSDAVYGALADRDALERWLAPGGMSARVLDFDFREGGSYRMRLQYRGAGEGRGKTTDDTDEVEVQFARLIPKRRIEQLVTFASADPAYAGTMKMTWDFQPRGSSTLVSIRCEDVPEGISPEDHAAGLASTLENLAEYVRSPGSRHSS